MGAGQDRLYTPLRLVGNRGAHQRADKFKGALVLVENEVTVGGQYDFWADDTGVQYQYPNQYRNRVQSGLSFVYYRGVRRGGGTRGTAEYFGVGVIGEIWSDPSQGPQASAHSRRWYCSIEEYVEFDKPVPAKRNGIPLESIKAAMGWRTGVREITSDVFNQIIQLAGIKSDEKRAKPANVSEAHANMEEVSDLLIVRPPTTNGGSGWRGRRFSGQAKEIGDWAEEVVYLWLNEQLEASERATLNWVAQSGETPGWDIAYQQRDGSRVCVEVKATTLARFSGIELTANEWRAATEHGKGYHLALVSKALSDQPKIMLLRDPARYMAEGRAMIEPLNYRFSLRGTATIIKGE